MPEDSVIPKMSLYVSRQRLDIGDLEPENIDIRDIAHNLSIMPRFAGNTSRPYSVAEHSIMVMQMVEDQVQDPRIVLQALLHDACEYILGDIPAPVKTCIPEIRDFENRVLWPVICERFSIPEEIDPAVKKADWVALFVEAHSLNCSDELELWEDYDKFWPTAEAWMNAWDPIEESTMPHPAMIEKVFLDCFEALVYAIQEFDNEELAAVH